MCYRQAPGIGLGLRTDRYPNATSTNPKISFRYQPLSQLLVRASYGRGFRVGALPELNNPQTVATTATFTDPVSGTSGQFSQTVGGNANLKPEKSEQSSLGLVIDPVPGVSIAVDYWKINVNNLITTEPRVHRGKGSGWRQQLHRSGSS
jgi:iron complex outermembrane receptor protein